MIKINLVKGISVTPGVDADLAGGGSERSATQRKALVNLVLIVIGPALLMVMEDSAMTERRQILAKARTQLSELEDKNNRAKSAVEETRRFRDEQARLELQIQSIENIKKNRKRELKLMEYLQRTIPDKVWLESMEINEARVLIRGLAITDGDLTSFMDALSRSAFLKEVSLQRSQETNNAEYGPLKQFELACLMESGI